MSVPETRRSSPKVHGIQHRLLTITASTILVPALIISYILYRSRVHLDIACISLLGLAVILILGGFISLRRVFNRLALLANRVSSAERDDNLIDVQNDARDLYEIAVPFNALMTRLNKATTELKHRAFQLFTVNELTEHARKTVEFDDLLDVLLDKAMAVTKAEIGSVYSVEREEKRLRVAASRGSDSAPKKNAYLNIDDSLARQLASGKRPLLVTDMENNPSTPSPNDPRSEPPSSLTIPISIRENPIAVLNLSHKEAGQAFDSQDEQFLGVATGAVGLALENTNLTAELGENVKKLEQLTEALADANDRLHKKIAEHKRAQKEKKKLEAQLQQAQRMEAIGTLAGGIAHDFNNVLSIIIGYSELSRYQLPKNNPVQAQLQEVYDAAIRGRDLVQQILTFSRQHGEEKKPLQIGPIIKEALKLLRASLPATIEIRENMRSTSDIVLANPTQIYQVLMNLCTNAAHSMRERGGAVEVSLEDVDIHVENANQNPDLNPGTYVKLTVSDTGTGIEPGIIERIFDPYFTTKEPGQGTGMGLAVAHGIVKGMGGAITVASKLGEGTTVAVFFPTAEGGLKPEARALSPFPTGTERILFVDDNKALVDMGARMLEYLGYQVVSRTSSIEALEAFRKKPERFDLVITNQTMPKMTGETLAQELIRIRPDIPIILCTGNSETISEDRAKTLGISKLLVKPVVIRDLSETIRQVLDQGVNTEM